MFTLKEMALLPICVANTLKNVWAEAANEVALIKTQEKGLFPEGFNTNGQFRFKTDDVLEVKYSNDEFFRDAKNWRVLDVLPVSAQHDTRKRAWQNDLRRDLYIIDVGNGVVERHFKTNIEDRLRPARRPTTVAALSCK